jgi:hypothetical protein
VSAAAVCLALVLAIWCVFQESNRREIFARQNPFLKFACSFMPCVSLWLGTMSRQTVQKHRIDYSVKNVYMSCFVYLYNRCVSVLIYSDLQPYVIWCMCSRWLQSTQELKVCCWSVCDSLYVLRVFIVNKTRSHVFIRPTCLSFESQSRDPDILSLTFCYCFLNNTSIAKATVGTKKGYSDL